MCDVIDDQFMSSFILTCCFAFFLNLTVTIATNDTNSKLTTKSDAFSFCCDVYCDAMTDGALTVTLCVNVNVTGKSKI